MSKRNLLRLSATVEFPKGMKDDHGYVLTAFKQTVLAALREEHAKKFGPLQWPSEINATAKWEEQ